MEKRCQQWTLPTSDRPRLNVKLEPVQVPLHRMNHWWNRSENLAVRRVWERNETVQAFCSCLLPSQCVPVLHCADHLSLSLSSFAGAFPKLTSIRPKKMNSDHRSQKHEKRHLLAHVCWSNSLFFFQFFSSLSPVRWYCVFLRFFVLHSSYLAASMSMFVRVCYLFEFLLPRLLFSSHQGNITRHLMYR